MTVAELLEKPENWCQGAYARNSGGGVACSVWSEAVSWCPIGAIFKVYGYENSIPMTKLTNVIGECIGEWNDNPKRTHAEVLEAVKKADI